MVARRKAARKPMTAYEAVAAALAKVGPVSDEEMAAFWGPDWKERERQVDEAIAAGRVRRYLSDDEFLAALEEASEGSADA